MKYIAPEYILNKIEAEDVITASNFIIGDILDKDGNPTGDKKGEYSVKIEDLFG